MSISLSTFNSNFRTFINGWETNHTDETGIYPYGIGFDVICNNNNRLMYFESHIESNTLPSNYTTSNIIDVGWSNVLPDVKSWATSVINSSNIIGVPFTPSIDSNSYLDFQNTSNFAFATYSNIFDTTVYRMEPYPSNNPSCWCVGFTSAKKSDAATRLSVDTQLRFNTLAIFRAEQTYLDLGWSNLKEFIGSWAQSNSDDMSALNTTITPSVW